jgi:hypothetical protein
MGSFREGGRQARAGVLSLYTVAISLTNKAYILTIPYTDNEGVNWGVHAIRLTRE